jgi:hypothetical protein
MLNFAPGVTSSNSSHTNTSLFYETLFKSFPSSTSDKGKESFIDVEEWFESMCNCTSHLDHLPTIMYLTIAKEGRCQECQ